MLVLGRDITQQKQSDAELHRYREHLEELVAARTTELAQANRQLQQEIEERRRAETALQTYSQDLSQMVEARTQALQEAQEKTYAPREVSRIRPISW